MLKKKVTLIKNTKKRIIKMRHLKRYKRKKIQILLIDIQEK